MHEGHCAGGVPELSKTLRGYASNIKSVRWLSMRKALRLVKVSLERSSSADVQGDAMEPPAQHFGMP